MKWRSIILFSRVVKLTLKLISQAQLPRTTNTGSNALIWDGVTIPCRSVWQSCENLLGTNKAHEDVYVRLDRGAIHITVMLVWLIYAQHLPLLIVAVVWYVHRLRTIRT